MGWSRHDIGRRLAWSDFRDWLTWLPPTAESAWFRARRPNTWWVSPELQMLAAVLYAVEGGNWQRGGGSGPQPKPVKFPTEPRPGDIDTAAKLAERRERLQQRRESRGQR